MRVSQREKDRSHRRIVQSAARLTRERGLEGASVAEVMSDAGLTHGGFYRHFDTKEALVAAGLGEAFDQILELLDSTSPPHPAPGAAVGFTALYLSDEHLRSPGAGCPIVTLGADMARASAELKAAFSAGVNRMIDRMSQIARGGRDARRAAATRQLAMMAGAMLIARASDPETAAAVLAACRGRTA